MIITERENKMFEILRKTGTDTTTVAYALAVHYFNQARTARLNGWKRSEEVYLDKFTIYQEKYVDWCEELGLDPVDITGQGGRE